MRIAFCDLLPLFVGQQVRKPYFLDDRERRKSFAEWFLLFAKRRGWRVQPSRVSVSHLMLRVLVLW
jgi:hypothetical protein